MPDESELASRFDTLVLLPLQPSIVPMEHWAGKALQLMRSWYTAMPGEKASCVGCHEQPKDTPLVRYETAALKAPVEIEPWYGPARGFNFEREVQPVLDKFCVGCHDGSSGKDGHPQPDLRAERFIQDYEGAPLSNLGASRLDPKLKLKFAPHKSNHKNIGDVKMRYRRRGRTPRHSGRPAL